MKPINDSYYTRENHGKGGKRFGSHVCRIEDIKFFRKQVSKGRPDMPLFVSSFPAKPPTRRFIYIMGIKFNHPVPLYSVDKKRLVVQVFL